uniref:Ig-like domain protein n=1 Tax=Siphoviridae sp. ctvGX2 TaxID=2826512 RepID=A0A8S5LZ57_9CAUD|nr:MAG TPA: Ig-like domain protein [Siphoviridae sp. ctvGX2]
MSLYDPSQFEIDDVGIPITGVAAYAPVTEANVIKDEDLGKATLTLPEAYRRLGLYKEDGGVEEERDDDDAIELFQEGYKLAGKSTTSVKIGLAEDNENVNRLIDGIEPNEHGVVYVPSSLPSNTILLFVATKYKSGRELRRLGVARISAVEVDQEERGSVKAKTVTFEWVPSPLIGGSPYKKWLGIPGGVTVAVAPKTATVKANQTVKLTATVTPAGRQVTWESSKPEVARVDSTGVVTGVKADASAVTITASSGGTSDTAQVTVTA